MAETRSSVWSADLKQACELQTFIPGQTGPRLQGTAFRFVSSHPIKVNGAPRPSADLWPRAVFAQLESLSDLFWVFPYLCASGSAVSVSGAVCTGGRERRIQTTPPPTARIPALPPPGPSTQTSLHLFPLLQRGVSTSEDCSEELIPCKWKKVTKTVSGV